MARKTYSDVMNKPVAQTVKTEPTQKKNASGGYVYRVDDWQQLERFLMMGTMGGTYYIGEQKLTKQNVDRVLACIQHDGLKVVDAIVEARKGNRALKADPAIYALALVVKHGSQTEKACALGALWQVAQTGTQLFQFVSECEGLKVGWGRAFKRGVGNWYNEKPIDKLSYQLAKYQQRDGWSHRDILRLAHPNPSLAVNTIPANLETEPMIEPRDALYRWATGKNLKEGQALIGTVAAFERAKTAEPMEIETIIRESGLPRECVPTTMLDKPGIWLALLESMPGTAMLRNLGKMASVNLFEMSGTAKSTVIGRLTSVEWLEKARLHPLSIYVAMKTFASGRGVKGSLTWRADPDIVDALSQAVELSYGTLPKIDKRVRIAVDTSGSMNGPRVCNSMVTLAEAAAVMSKAFMHQASNYDVMLWSDDFRYVPASKGQRTDDLARVMRGDGGGTNMGLAFDPGLPADLVLVFTDSETYLGTRCEQVWGRFKDKNPGAKAVVLSMVANRSTGLDPADPDVLQVVGFDTAAPQVVAAFAGLDAPATDED